MMTNENKVELTKHDKKATVWILLYNIFIFCFSSGIAQKVQPKAA